MIGNFESCQELEIKLSGFEQYLAAERAEMEPRFNNFTELIIKTGRSEILLYFLPETKSRR